MFNIGLLGLGTVGTGVVQILEERKDYLEGLTNQRINLSKILVRDLCKERDVDTDKYSLTTDIDEIIKDDNITVVIEVLGGIDFPYIHIKEALKRGKSVITANKAVVSKHLEEFSALAKENNVLFLYDASVGGGIPIIKPLKEQANINAIQEIRGILNGTSNYILTKMIAENLDFKEALKISQNLGYAEADPTDDVEGFDARRKLRILSTIAFKDKIQEKDIPCYGINSINAKDIKNIKEMDCTVKLLGTAIVEKDQYYATVEPVILDKNSYLGNVDNANNIVSFTGDKVGELRFFGAGAGRFPTANAVINDLIDVLANSYPKNCTDKDIELSNITNLFKGKYYMRINGDESIGEKIEEYIKKNEISEDILNKDENIAFITKLISKKRLEELISKFTINNEDYFVARLEA